MRVLQRDDERVEIELVDTTVTVRRFAADAVVDTTSQTFETLLRAKLRADLVCARELTAGFELVGRDAVVALSHAELMAAIDANPDDHDTRLVLADWLTEHGDPWGQIIAIQTLKEQETDDARYDELDRADFELRVAHKSRLWGELADVPIDSSRQLMIADIMHVEWECGFVREVMLESPRADLVPIVLEALGTLDVARLLRILYVTRLERAKPLLDQLAARRWPHLRELHVAHIRNILDPDQLLNMLAACTPALDVLTLDGIGSADALCQALARAPLASRLRALSLRGNEFTADGIAALADAPFDRLETLHVTGAGPEDARTVLRGRAHYVTVELERFIYEL